MDTSFCMDGGQIRKGDGNHDTYVKMLQQNVRITAPISYGIATEYPIVMDLVQGFRSKGPTALKDLDNVRTKGVNQDSMVEREQACFIRDPRFNLAVRRRRAPLDEGQEDESHRHEDVWRHDGCARLEDESFYRIPNQALPEKRCYNTVRLLQRQ